MTLADNKPRVACCASLEPSLVEAALVQAGGEDTEWIVRQAGVRSLSMKYGSDFEGSRRKLDGREMDLSDHKTVKQALKR